MNKTITVIISPSYGTFEPNRAFTKILKDAGQTDWSTLEARTDTNLIKAIGDFMSKKPNDFDIAFLGKTKDQYLALRQVDTTKPWTIIADNGAESIRALAFEVVNPELNYCELLA